MSIATASRVVRAIYSPHNSALGLGESGGRSVNPDSTLFGVAATAGNMNGGSNSSADLTSGETRNSHETSSSSSEETNGSLKSSVIKAGTKLEHEYLYRLKDFLRMLFTLGIAKSLVKKREARRVDESIEICVSFATQLPEQLEDLKSENLPKCDEVVLYRNVEKRYELILDSNGEIFAYLLDKELKQSEKAIDDPLIKLDNNEKLAQFRDNVKKITDDLDTDDKLAQFRDNVKKIIDDFKAK